MEAINDAMQVRMTLLKETGYNVETAQKCWDFVRGSYEAKKQEPATVEIKDGIYIFQQDGFVIPYTGEKTITFDEVTYIGIVQGSHSVAISLHDVSEDEITLTSKKDDGKGRYIDSYMDAVQDWQGKKNTEHLQAVGLNPAIQLKDGEYIPTLAELYLICLNLKAINAAMRFVGGQELAGWYWSSTESSATNAWYLYLTDGYADHSTLRRRTRAEFAPFQHFYTVNS